MNAWLRAVWALTWATTTAIFRSRIYVGLVAAGALLIGLSLMLAELAVGEMVTSLVDIGLAFIALVISLLAIVNVCSNPASNSNPRQVISILARPIPRSTVVVSRFIAVAALAVVASALLGGLLTGVVAWFGGPALRTFVAALTGSLEAVVVASVALLLWSRLGATTAIVVFLLGRMDTATVELLDKGTFGAAAPVLRVVAHLLPHLSHFDLTAWVHRGSAAPAWAALYAAGYATAMVLLAVQLYRGRDFT
jgi:hypothetical protein